MFIFIFPLVKQTNNKKNPALQKFSYEDMPKFYFSLVAREENEPGWFKEWLDDQEKYLIKDFLDSWLTP